MQKTGRLCLAIIAASLAGLFAMPAIGHPHVLISVRTRVILADDGTIAELRHAWTFDEAFSSFATQGLDKNGNGRLDREELVELAKINVESLNEYGYFSYLKHGKVNAEFGAVKDYWLDHDGKSLVLNFTLPVLAKSPPVREAKLEVYDPSYFVAFDFAKEDPVKVEGGKLVCAANVAPPKPSVAQRLSQLGETFFQTMQPGANAEWAIPIRFECK